VGKGWQNALMRRWLPASAAVLATLLLALPFGGADRSLAQAGPRCVGAGHAPREATLHFMRSSVLCLVNRVREHYGLAPLRYSADLRNSATGHSNDMVANHYFSHDGLNGSTPGGRVARSGYLARVSTYFIGENIGGGKSRRFGSPLAVYRAWMHSPPHRANILDRGFREFGVGVARGFPYGGGANAATYTLDLGSRR
jgi:uncharacterized protein YkwD